MSPARRTAPPETPPARPTASGGRSKHRPWVGFAFSAALTILAVFVLHDVAAGVTALAAMLSFIGACMYALRGADPDALARGERSALGGWVGGWF